LFRRRDGPARDCRQAVAFLHLIPYQGGARHRNLVTGEGVYALA
jgi:hypothetical protein